MSQTVMHGAKMLPQKQQSRQRPRSAALPSSPIRAVFLDSISWVVEPAVMCSFTFVPTLPFQEGGTLSPTGKHSVCAQGLQMLMGFIHNRQHINRAKECPDRGTFVGASRHTKEKSVSE